MASAQVWGGVQRKTTRKSTKGAQASRSVTAVQPIRVGKQPAIPPQTVFCQVRRLSHNV